MDTQRPKGNRTHIHDFENLIKSKIYRLWFVMKGPQWWISRSSLREAGVDRHHRDILATY